MSITVRYSIIIPHFGNFERLERLLRSIPVSREDLEVLVIDDCSVDQEALFVVRKSWPTVVWLSTLTNSGAGVARNLGLETARGRWVIFADSDDEFLPTAFEYLDKTLCSEYELIYFLADSVYEVDGRLSLECSRMNELVEQYARFPDEQILTKLRLSHVVPWAKVYSRSFVRKTGLQFDAVRWADDIAFNTLAAVKATRVQAQDFCIYRRYICRDSLTHDESPEAFVGRFLTSRSLANRLSALGIRRVRPASGYMLRALRYGPFITFRIWFLSVFSPMTIDFRFMFSLARWKRFLKKRLEVTFTNCK